MLLRVGTYNVFGMPWGSKNLRAILLWIILQSGTEIMCLQEVWSKEHQQMIRKACEDSKVWTCYFPYSNIHRLGRITSRFHSGSGLCILVKNTVEIIDELEGHTYIISKGVDGLVRKGFMILQCRKENKVFQIVNTHFQSDMTEIPCWRIRYNEIRLKQEKQLYQTVRHLSCPIVLGDFNTEEFMYFECLEKGHRWTYKDTGERLDSCLRTFQDKHKFEKVDSNYHYNIGLSDHIPVVFTLRLDTTQP
jgi:endonuclease/exonuclease/phosphatase family metal-dependent hydrolase